MRGGERGGGGLVGVVRARGAARDEPVVAMPNPFYQIYLMDMTTGDVSRVSPGIGKTTCSFINPETGDILFSSTHHDPRSTQLQEEELKFRASGQERRPQRQQGRRPPDTGRVQPQHAARRARRRVDAAAFVQPAKHFLALRHAACQVEGPAAARVGA